MSPSGAPLTRRRAWRALVGHQKKLENLHLRTLFAEDPQRGERLALEAVGLYLDYSKNLVTDETLRLLVKLAADCGLRERIDAMFRGEKINVTEDRAALHVALRAPRGASFVVDGENVGAVKQLEQEGATGCSSLDGFVDALAPPRAVWMMVPVAFVDETIASLVPLLASEDILIDGGNTRYHDDIRRARELEPAGIHYLDVGTSGGVWGLERGYCLMIGGEEGSVRQLDPIFAALAPPVDSVSRTPGREKSGGTAEHGYLHCGPHGAGQLAGRSRVRQQGALGDAPRVRRTPGEEGLKPLMFAFRRLV